MADLNVATCKLKVDEDERYRAKFANLLKETKQTQIKLNEQRHIEEQLDKEIVKMEIKLNNHIVKTKKAAGDGPAPINVNYDFRS